MSWAFSCPCRFLLSELGLHAHVQLVLFLISSPKGEYRVDWSSFCIPQQLSDLKADNQRLKDENGALIRVISKLSRPPTWPSSLGHNSNDWKRLLRLISTAKAVVAVFSWSLKLYLFIQYETTTQRFLITLVGRGGRSPAYFFFLCRYVYVL